MERFRRWFVSRANRRRVAELVAFAEALNASGTTEEDMVEALGERFPDATLADMRAAMEELPPGWGQDSLSEFVEMARRNTLATFVRTRRVWGLLGRIDGAFWRAVEGMNNARAWFAGFFLLRAHASYLGAVRLSASGQVPEAYIVLRGCLENALYGFFLHENPGLRAVWLSRHDDDASRQRVRDEFRTFRMLDLLETKDRETGRAARTLYERTIDFGAHPNEMALLTVLRHSEEEGAVRFDLNYLSDDSTPALALCLKTKAQVGVWSLRVFRLVVPERFDLLGLTDEPERRPLNFQGGPGLVLCWREPSALRELR